MNILWLILIGACLLASTRYCRISGTTLRSRTPSGFAGRLRTLSSLLFQPIEGARSNLWEQMHWYRRRWFWRKLCSRYWEGRYRRRVESEHGSQQPFRAAALPEGWCLLKVWLGCLWVWGGLLALEHDDVLVVLIDLAIGIRSPKFLYLVCGSVPLFLQIKSTLHYKIIIFRPSPPQRMHPAGVGPVMLKNKFWDNLFIAFL